METGKKLRLVADEASLRLDKYIFQSCPEYSRSNIQKLIEDGYVIVNDKVAKSSLKTKTGDVIIIDFPPSVTTSVLVPENIPLDIVYENSDLLVINKPAGITVHPAPGHPSHTLVNAILAHCPDIIGLDTTVRPGIVHRLDKNTSGLMVVAKNKETQSYLAAQMKNRSILKKYLTLVRGCPHLEEGDIQAPIGRHVKNRKKMAVIAGGREAHTSYRLVRPFKGYSLVEATIKTGRTHQIRVHFSYIGCPVIGDDIYGVKIPFLNRQFLHASLLGLRMPGTGEWVEFTSELPVDLERALVYVSSL